MIIFNNIPANFILISADVLLKIILILSELRIAQLCSYNEGTLVKILDFNALKQNSSSPISIEDFTSFNLC